MLEQETTTTPGKTRSKKKEHADPGGYSHDQKPPRAPKRKSLTLVRCKHPVQPGSQADDAESDPGLEITKRMEPWKEEMAKSWSCKGN